MAGKNFIICNTIVRIVAFVCITYAALYLRNPKLLWWYLVPLLMSPTTND